MWPGCSKCTSRVVSRPADAGRNDDRSARHARQFPYHESALRRPQLFAGRPNQRRWLESSAARNVSHGPALDQRRGRRPSRATRRSCLIAPSRLAGAVSIDVASAAAGESAMTPELEQKIWCAYRDAHLALAVAADGYVNTPLAAFIRKRMAEVWLARAHAKVPGARRAK
jgi:hypothetical protein